MWAYSQYYSLYLSLQAVSAATGAMVYPPGVSSPNLSQTKDRLALTVLTLFPSLKVTFQPAELPHQAWLLIGSNSDCLCVRNVIKTLDVSRDGLRVLLEAYLPTFDDGNEGHLLALCQ